MVGLKFFQTQGMKLRLIKAGPQIKFIRNMSTVQTILKVKQIRITPVTGSN